MTYTPAWAITTYLEIRDEQNEDTKTYEKRSVERETKMDLLEKFLLGAMKERGEENIKTEAGVAYKSPQMRVTMTDRQAVIDFVLDRIEENNPNAFNLFTNHINKEEVKRLLDKGIPVPGVDVKTFTACNVRKT